MAPVPIPRVAYQKTKLSDENLERISARSLLLQGRPILSGLETLSVHMVGAVSGTLVCEEHLAHLSYRPRRC